MPLTQIFSNTLEMLDRYPTTGQTETRIRNVRVKSVTPESMVWQACKRCANMGEAVRRRGEGDWERVGGRSFPVDVVAFSGEISSSSVSELEESDSASSSIPSPSGQYSVS